MSLHISGLNVRYRTRILHDISLQIADGEVLAIIGPSGSGKTTFLHAIAGLTQIETGKISVNGINITQLRTDRRRVGLAFQNPALFDMTVKENIEFGIDDPDIPALRRAQLADITMSALNIIDLAQRHVRTLSGGQAQRVALARTLAAEPQILLLDEPMAHLEAAVQQNIHADLLAQIKRHQIPTIYVTHDLADACAVADRIAVMDQGQIVQIGTAEELFFRPNSPVVAQMLGVANIFSVQAEKSPHALGKEADIGVQDGAKVSISLGRTTILVSCAKSFTGAGIVFFTPNNVILRHSKSRSVFGLTGKVLRRSFARSHYIYWLETEFGTVISWQLTQYPPGAYVDLDFQAGWAIPAAAEPQTLVD